MLFFKLILLLAAALSNNSCLAGSDKKWMQKASAITIIRLDAMNETGELAVKTKGF